MSFTLPAYGGRSYGKSTATAGTVFTRLVEPHAGMNAITRLLKAIYTAGVTAHTLTAMRPLNATTTSAAASAGQAVINLTADPGDYTGSRVADNLIAANDYLAYQCADGTWVVDTVSSVSTLAITMTTNVPTGGVNSGAPVFFYGIITDTNPANSLAHPQFTLPASTVTTLEDRDVGFVSSVANPNANFTNFYIASGKGQPLILHSGNASNAGVLEMVTAMYTTK